MLGRRRTQVAMAPSPGAGSQWLGGCECGCRLRSQGSQVPRRCLGRYVGRGGCQQYRASWPGSQPPQVLWTSPILFLESFVTSIPSRAQDAETAQAPAAITDPLRLSSILCPMFGSCFQVHNRHNFTSPDELTLHQ